MANETALDTGVADGDVWRTLVLRRRLQESPDTVSFVLGTPDGSPLACDAAALKWPLTQTSSSAGCER